MTVSGKPILQEERGAYIQANTASLKTDDKNLRLTRRCLESSHCLIALLDVHRSVEAVPRKALAF